MLKKIIYLLLFIQFLVYSQELPRFIDVNGTSEIQVDADHIYFVVAIRNIAETLQESKDINTKTTEELVRVFNEYKLDKDDWEITPIRFGKEYSRGSNEREFIGYYSSTSISVKLRKIDDYFSFINKLSSIQNIEVVRSDYGLSENIKYNKEAILQATKDAYEKAKYIAESLDMDVGMIYQIDELNKNESYPNPFNSSTSLRSSSENMVGKIKIVRSINMKIQLIDKF